MQMRTKARIINPMPTSLTSSWKPILEMERVFTKNGGRMKERNGDGGSSLFSNLIFYGHQSCQESGHNNCDTHPLMSAHKDMRGGQLSQSLGT
ncbi:hypothetical protein LINPERHAP1_LOCUS26016 [Linum perenne]